MNNHPVRNPFWHDFGPLLAYWGVQFVAQIIVGLVLVMMNAQELADVMGGSSVMSDSQLNAMTERVTGLMLEIMLKYQVQIQAAVALCTIPVSAVFFRMDRKREKQAGTVPARKAPLWKYGWLLVLGAAVSIGVTCLGAMTELALADQSYQRTSEVFYSASFPVQLACLGIVMPLSEELIFRGVLYKRFKERNVFWKAALSTSILFALIHTNSFQIIYALAFGMLLAYVYEKYGSFKAPCVLHISANLVSILCTQSGVFGWLGASPGRMGAAVVACAFVGAVMFVLIQHMDEKPGGPDETKQQDGQNITLDMFR